MYCLTRAIGKDRGVLGLLSVLSSEAPERCKSSRVEWDVMRPSILRPGQGHHSLIKIGRTAILVIEAHVPGH